MGGSLGREQLVTGAARGRVPHSSIHRLKRQDFLSPFRSELHLRFPDLLTPASLQHPIARSGRSVLLSFAEGHDAILAELGLATRHEGMTSDGVQSCMWRRDGKFQRVSWVVGRSMWQWHMECPLQMLADVGSEGERFLDVRVKELEMTF